MLNSAAAQREKQRRRIEAARQRLDNDVLDRGETPLEMGSSPRDWRDDVHPNYFRQQVPVEKGRRAVRQSEVRKKLKPTPEQAWAEYNAQRRAQGLGDDPDSPQFKAAQVWEGAAQNRASSQRMAGDTINEQLSEGEIRGLDSLLNGIKEDEVGDLIQANNSDVQMYRQLKSRDDGIEKSFVKAGLTPEQAKRVQYDTDAIVKGEVPAAYVPNEGAKSGGRVGNVIQPTLNAETRYHTEYELNPLTGQQDIVPFISEGVPLVTQFGRTGLVDGVNTDEFLAQRLRQLVRQDVKNNNLGDNYADVDFIDKATGRKVDAELTTTDKIKDGRIGVQAYTSIATPSTVRTSPKEIGAAVKKEVLNELSSYDVNLETAIDELAESGRLVNGTGQNVPRPGKVFNYDEVVYPVTTSRMAQANNNRHDITFPLEGAYQVDVQGAKDMVQGLSGKELEKSLTFPTYSGHRDDPKRYPVAKVYVQVPTSNKQVVRNLAETNPIVRQLFSKQ
jgi:hypothetical protein